MLSYDFVLMLHTDQIPACMLLALCECPDAKSSFLAEALLIAHKTAIHLITSRHISDAVLALYC